MEQSGNYRAAHRAQGPFFHPMDVIRHNRGILRAWTTLILDKSNGFMQAGVERLNNSIRTYVWAILGSQAQARTKSPTPKSNSWQTSKTRSRRPWTSSDPSLATRRPWDMLPSLWTSSLELDVTSSRRRWNFILGTSRAIITK